jgi:ferritin-like metal-binding protein YciE
MAGQVATLHDLFIRELRDLLYVEKRLVKELPKMAKMATDEDLRAAFEEHAEQTGEHAARLERLFEMIGVPARSERCEGIDGLLEEAKTMMEETRGSALRDAAMIAAAQRVEHYEIAAYGCARAFANQLRLDEAVGVLDQTIGEEGATDKALSDIAVRRVNPEAYTAPPEQVRSGRTPGRQSARRAPARNGRNGRSASKAKREASGGRRE